MFQCPLCDYSTLSITSYSKHYRIHRNVHNFRFPCGVLNCSQTFLTYSVFNSHVSRNHSRYRREHSSRHDSLVLSVKCRVGNCEQQCSDMSSVIKHMKSHIDSGIQATCPFVPCSKSFTKKSSFTSHVSRYHKNTPIQTNQDNQDVQNDFRNETISESGRSDNIVDLEPSDEFQNIMQDTSVSQQDFSNNFALFCLKLQAELLIPQSTVQCIVEELESMHEVVSESCILRLKNKLQDEGLSENSVSAVTDYMRYSYEWGNVLSKESGTLRSVHLRKAYYQTHMNNVSPESVCLGRDHIRGAVCYHYVPLKETLSMLLSDKAVQAHVQQLHESTDTSILSDYTDGTAFKKN